MVWPSARPAQPTRRAISLSFILAKEPQAQPPLHLARKGPRIRRAHKDRCIIRKFDREKGDEVRVAQTSDYLSCSRVAGDSGLFPGASVARRWRGRELD